MKNNNLIYGDIGILENRKINGFNFDYDAEDAVQTALLDRLALEIAV
jgi:hypothetical protein